MIHYGETILQEIHLTPMEKDKLRVYVNYRGLGTLKQALMFAIGAIDTTVEPEDLLDGLAKAYGLLTEDIMRNRPKGISREAKRVYMYFLKHKMGYMDQDIADRLSLGRSTVTRQVRGVEEDTKFNPILSGMFMTTTNIYDKLRKHEEILD